MAFNRALMRYKRRRMFMTMDDMAAKITSCGRKTSKTSISNWENGKRNPSLKSVKLIAKALKCKPEELITEEVE